ncbi:TIGR03619 family F420-dependent LLM class oxidoreductase [Sphaerisporangium sp. NPDC051017]|uniref:TIGR03619 family F420-dependent LLM class oxidoreductase n=1 Tax=Sphaerisporangium sp. NPDC051017 TaxID=3154636 RepID=UPI00343C4783
MEIGFGVPVSGPWATPANMARVARRAQELGYASLWTFQRLLYPVGHPMGPVYRAVQDPIVTLSYLAGVTEGIRLGLAIVNLPFYSPALLAKQLATLQTVSGGRLDAGLGLGWLPEEFAASGVPMEGRGRRAVECLQVLRRLWTDEVISHRGEFYEIPPSHQDPKPRPGPPPVLLGGTAEVALRRAGELADGWISSSRADLATIQRADLHCKGRGSQGRARSGVAEVHLPGRHQAARGGSARPAAADRLAAGDPRGRRGAGVHGPHRAVPRPQLRPRDLRPRHRPRRVHAPRRGGPDGPGALASGLLGAAWPPSAVDGLPGVQIRSQGFLS